MSAILIERDAATPAPARPRRLALAGSRQDRLFYAQVHEDPRLELECFAPVLHRPLAMVSSGGCTVLSLLAAGATDVRAVDLNAAQNHLVELKLAALTTPGVDAAAFLGASPMPRSDRLAAWQLVAPRLSERAHAYWNEHTDAVARGVLGAGASERFISLAARIARTLVHPRALSQRLLACTSLAEQRQLYQREWNTWRWRLLFRLLLGRRGLSASHGPAMFRHVEDTRFAEHFRSRFEHTVTALSVADNYFLHYALTDRYPDDQDGRPPWLAPEAAESLSDAARRLTLVDAPFTGYLRTLPNASLAGVSLSNICEWLDADGIDALFAEIARTARPGAVVCFRNFVGWTEVPERWRSRIVEDRLYGEALLARDRSLVNRRFAACRVEAAP